MFSRQYLLRAISGRQVIGLMAVMDTIGCRGLGYCRPLSVCSGHQAIGDGERVSMFGMQGTGDRTSATTAASTTASAMSASVMTAAIGTAACSLTTGR